MKIKWEQNACYWFGKPKEVFPQFKAWQSDESSDYSWCLNMVRSPNARPIKIRDLQSLDAAKEFAQALLVEYDYVYGNELTVSVESSANKHHLARAVRTHPLPQTT